MYNTQSKQNERQRLKHIDTVDSTRLSTVYWSCCHVCEPTAS